MEELYKYKQNIKEMDLEQLLKELEKQVVDSQCHRFVSKNETLVSKCQNKIMLVKLQIIELFKENS